MDLMRSLQKSNQPMMEGSCIGRPATILETLKARQVSLTAQIASVNEAIEALESTPDVQRVLEAIGKAL